MWDLSGLTSKWNEIAENLITAAGDKVTVYKRPTVSGTATNYSTFYEESIDYNAVLTVSGFGTQSYTTNEVTGRVYLNVYGWQFSQREELQQLPVGNIQPGDVIFQALATDILLDSDNPSKGTVFDGSDFVVVEKDNGKYSFTGAYPNGLGALHNYYILLRKSDEQEITYT